MCFAQRPQCSEAGEALNNSADSDEMAPDMAFHVGLHCLQKNLFTGFQNEKGYRNFVQ